MEKMAGKYSFVSQDKFKDWLKAEGKSLDSVIWKNYLLYWDFDLKSWIVDFFTRFTWEKTPQYNFSSQNFSVENNYWYHLKKSRIFT